MENESGENQGILGDVKAKVIKAASAGRGYDTKKFRELTDEDINMMRKSGFDNRLILIDPAELRGLLKKI